jgi:predicted permease
MQWASRVAHFVGRLLHRGRAEDDLQQEVQAYFDTMVERHIARGLTQEEARRAARLETGGAERVREQVRDVWAGAWIEAAFLDARYACRALRKNPGFAAAATLSLGLGLGANIAIFTLVNTVILQSLPVKDQQRLFFIDNSGGKSGGSSGPPYPCYEILRDHNHYFAGMAAFKEDRFRVTIDGAEEKMTGQYASGSYFDVLGLRAATGRLFAPEDDSVVGSGGPDGAVAVISYRLWERRFGRSPAVLGKDIKVGTTWVRIAGVSPPGFDGLTPGLPVDVTIPMMLTSNNLQSKRNWWFSVVGRLKDGAAAEPARAELDALFKTYMDETGGRGNRYFSGIVLVSASKGLNGLRRKFSKPLLIVMAIAGLVLLIGCANAANLLLARASARRNEMALRLAIGASRWRLVRQLLTEGLLLTGMAALVGVFLAKWGASALVTLLAGVSGRIVLEAHFDWRVMAFTAAVGLLTSLLFSIAPAVHASRADAAKPGKDARAVGTGAFPLRAGSALVVVQITLSVVLLCGAALFLRSLRNLTTLDAGFQREGVITVEAESILPGTSPKPGKETEEELARIGRMWEEVLAPVSELAAARAVSASTLSPLSGKDRGILMKVSGEQPRPGLDQGIHANQATAGYFTAFGIALLAGRVFTPADAANSRRVAILNEAAVQRFLPNSNPVGRRVSFPGQRITDEYEIVGVVRDTRYETLRTAAEPMVYVPLQQAFDRLGRVTIAIRARGGATGILAVLRDRVRKTVPGGFTSAAARIEQQVDESLVEERLLSILANLFGGLALLLAAIGIYGIVSFAVVRRTREIGIRMAIGARRTSVVWLVMRQTLALGVAGLALGIPFVCGVKSVIESELYGIRGSDPSAIGGAIALLLAVAVAVGSWPAWRASRLDPMVCLRHE